MAKQNQVGDKNPNWKGGRFESSGGYIWLWEPRHPFSSKVSPKGYVLEHRFVMEQKLNRLLVTGEVIHHINGIRNDNRIENLVLTNSGKHIGEHNSKRTWKKGSREKSRLNVLTRKRNGTGQFI